MILAQTERYPVAHCQCSNDSPSVPLNEFLNECPAAVRHLLEVNAKAGRHPLDRMVPPGIGPGNPTSSFYERRIFIRQYEADLYPFPFRYLTLIRQVHAMRAEVPAFAVIIDIAAAELHMNPAMNSDLPRHENCLFT